MRRITEHKSRCSPNTFWAFFTSRGLWFSSDIFLVDFVVPWRTRRSWSGPNAMSSSPRSSRPLNFLSLNIIFLFINQFIFLWLHRGYSLNFFHDKSRVFSSQRLCLRLLFRSTISIYCAAITYPGSQNVVLSTSVYLLGFPIKSMVTFSVFERWLSNFRIPSRKHYIKNTHRYKLEITCHESQKGCL